MQHLESAVRYKDAWWKYVVLILVALLASNLIGAIPLLIVVTSKIFASNSGIELTMENITNFDKLGIDKNYGLLLMLLPFAIGLIGMLIMYKPLHKRKYTYIINGTTSIRWNKFFYTFFIWFLLSALALLVSYLFNKNGFQFNWHPKRFAILFLISFIFLPFQTSFEEVIFRGYLAQGVGAIFKVRFLAIIIPGILFGLMHYFNPEVKAYGFWATMPSYIFYGVLFGLISTLDDGIESSMGAHAANNIFNSLFVTSAGSVLQTDALLVNNSPSISIDNIMLYVLGVLLVIILHFKYNWNWNILSQKIQ